MNKGWAPLLFRHRTVGTRGVKDVHLAKPLDSDETHEKHGHTADNFSQYDKELEVVLFVLGRHFSCRGKLAPLLAPDGAREMQQMTV